MYGIVAQLEERLLHTQEVIGSRPVGPITKTLAVTLRVSTNFLLANTGLGAMDGGAGLSRICVISVQVSASFSIVSLFFPSVG